MIAALCKVGRKETTDNICCKADLILLLGSRASIPTTSLPQQLLTVNSGANISSLKFMCLIQREKIKNHTQNGKANFKGC